MAQSAATSMPLSAAAVLLACNSWDDFRRAVAPLPKKLMGDCFELLTLHYLRLEPQYKTTLRSVWRLRDVPRAVRAHLRLPGPDEGIDLVAETHEGGFWAIQCKYRQDEKHSTSFTEVSTFLALRADRGFDLALICTSADSYSGKLKHHERLAFCAGDVWRGLGPRFWSDLHADLKGRVVPAPVALKPKLHQKAAIADTLKHLGAQPRGKLVMPCGTGKSLTAFWIADKLRASRILVAVPSLALVRQMLHVWNEQFLALGHRPRWVAVCSDESVGKRDADDAVTHVHDLGVAVQTAPAAIAEWLSTHRDGDRTIVFTTYQSGKATAQAAKLAGFKFDLGIFDEAHKTAGKKAGAFAHLLHDGNIEIGKRLYMTATERHYAGVSDEIVSMDDESIYGPTAHKLIFKAALDAGVLCDYQVLLVECRRAEVESLIRRRRFVKGRKLDFEIEADTLAAAVALRKTMTERPVRHALSFHSSVARAARFKELQEAVTAAFPKYRGLDVFHVSGRTPTAVRSRELADFAAAKTALVTNARCLTEGVDIPTIDGILFADPRQSTVDIVQAVGRAMRRADGKKLGYVIVPVLLEDDEEKPSDEAFAAILRVLQALASNDERIVAYFRTVAEGRKWTGRKPFEADLPLGVTIDEAAFEQAIGVRVWERIAKLNRRPFKEARTFARGLGLKRQAAWVAFTKSGRKPADIPTAPWEAYRDDGWVNIGDWLGTGRLATWLREYRSFSKARAFVRKLGLTDFDAWRSYAKSGKKPDDIPSAPNRVYKSEGWVDMGDWLGTGRIAAQKRRFRRFRDARRFVRSLGLSSVPAWRTYTKSAGKPADIPADPAMVYRNRGWTNFGDWLGSGRVADRQRVFRPFKEAREYARSLQLKSRIEWLHFAKSGGRPSDIPSSPNNTYKNRGWLGFGDWLGTGNVAPSRQKRRRFEEARAYVRALGLKSQTAWFMYAKSGKKPSDIPYDPRNAYKHDGWRGYGDWLGTGNVRWGRAPTLKGEAHFAALRQYAKREGHARPPPRHVEAGMPIGKWVQEQRRLYARDALTKEQQRKLESLPKWTWNLKLTEAYERRRQP